MPGGRALRSPNCAVRSRACSLVYYRAEAKYGAESARPGRCGGRVIGLWRNAEWATVNPDKINKWLTLLANLAVIAGIVFLAIELNQNSRMMQTQTRNAVTESILNFQINAETAGLRDIAQKGTKDPASLTADEAGKLAQLYVSNLRLWENIHYQYRNGVFDEAEFTAERNSWRGLGERTPLLRGVYCQLKRRGSLSPAFVAEMDKLAYGDPGSCADGLNLFGPPPTAQ
jgi:hypothetical protein